MEGAGKPRTEDKTSLGAKLVCAILGSPNVGNL